MNSSNAIGNIQPHVTQDRLPSKKGSIAPPCESATPYRQGWTPTPGFYWCPVDGKSDVNISARPNISSQYTSDRASTPSVPLPEGRRDKRSTRPAVGFFPRDGVYSCVSKLEKVSQSYKVAVDIATAETMWNPMGELDQSLFVPAAWRARQNNLNRRGAQKTAIGVEAILIAQDMFSPVHYVLNKALGNGRVHSSWASTTTGAIANANIKPFIGRQPQQRVVGGLVPSISRLLTHLSALTGAGIGHLANSMNGKNDAVAYAVWGAHVGMCLGWGITQASIGINFALKSAVALPPGVALVVLMAALFLAVRWAALNHGRASAQPTGVAQ